MTVLPFDKKKYHNNHDNYLFVIFIVSRIGIYFNSKMLSLVIHAENDDSEIAEKRHIMQFVPQ